MAVRQDTERSSTQITAIAGADCSPITIRRHLRGKGFENKKCLQLRTFGDGRQGKFTKMDISSRQWMPFVKPSSPKPSH